MSERCQTRTSTFKTQKRIAKREKPPEGGYSESHVKATAINESSADFLTPARRLFQADTQGRLANQLVDEC
jgi:hypothetical protein